MKHFIATVVFLPVAISIVCEVLMMLARAVQSGSYPWIMWMVALLSIMLVFFITSALVSSCFIQLSLWRTRKYPLEKNMV